MTDAPLPHIPTQFVSPDDDQAPDRTVSVGSRLPDVPEPEPEHDAPERDEEAVAATPAAAPPRPDEHPTRFPIAAGTYAIYDDDNGGLVLVAKTQDGETHHKHVPARIIKMAQAMMGGNNPLAMLFGS